MLTMYGIFYFFNIYKNFLFVIATNFCRFCGFNTRKGKATFRLSYVLDFIACLTTKSLYGIEWKKCRRDQDDNKIYQSGFKCRKNRDSYLYFPFARIFFIMLER